jgi:Flp pilus assembly protein TadG
MTILAPGAAALSKRGRGLAAVRRLSADQRGASAVEFGLIALILVPLLLNVIDFSFLIWARMQVDYAAAVGAQAAYNMCLSDKDNCQNNWNGPVAAAANSTSLGTLDSSAASERYYCTVGTTLQPPDGLPPPASSLPPDCGAQGDPNTKPARYVRVNVTYTFAPLFAELSLVPQQSLAAIGLQSLN